MKHKIRFRFSWLLVFVALLHYGCGDLELTDKMKPVSPDLDFSARGGLSKKILDSTNTAESAAKNSIANPITSPRFVTLGTNYALQATVTAESTYPGYSVQKIKDGSRVTTVGPAYSWANNFPGGGKLPESVFLKFSSLKSINRIDIYTSTGYVLQNYTIQYRITSTGSWINLAVVTGNTFFQRIHSFTTINLLEVQIICQLGPSNQTIYGRLNEVEIYGPPEPTLPPISVENGMLVFNSAVDIQQAMDYLEFKYEQYTDAFVAQYPGVSDDQLADIEELTGFNDEQPFIEFESIYGLNSLRSMITGAEDTWLATTAGDSTAGPDPDDAYMDEDELRTLVNVNGEVKVGSTYYVFQSDGSYYTYSGGQLPSIASQLKSGGALPYNVTYFPAFIAPPADCKTNAKNKNFKTSGTWRYKYKVKVSDGPFAGSGRSKAVTKSYRKKFGKWQKRIATIGAYVWGDLVDTDCLAGPTIDSGYKEKKRRKVKAKVSHQNVKVKKNQVTGEFGHSKVPYHVQLLTW